MSLELTIKGNYRIITVRQDLTDTRTLSALSNLIHNLMAQGENRFVLDLSQISGINTGILGVVADIFKKLKGRDTDFKVIVRNHEMEDVFNISQLTAQVRVHTNLAQVLQSLGDSADGGVDAPPVDGNFDVQTRGDYKIIQVRHELTRAASIEAFKRLLEGFLEQGQVKFVLDFRNQSMVASAILGILAALQKRMAALHGEILVVADHPDVIELFNLTGLSDFMRLYKTQESFLSDARKRNDDISPVLVMIASGNPDDRRVLEMKVRSMGYAVLTAATGAEALEKIRKIVPDLVLIDSHLPGMDGAATCTRIKQTVQGRHVPVLFITEPDKPTERLRALECGGDDFLHKPFNEEELASRIRSHLKIKRLTENLLMVNRDLEERVQAKSAELMDTERQLLQSEKMSMIGTFLSGAAHELKNPLFVISGWTQMLRKKQGLMDEHLRCIGFIEESTRRCVSIVEDLLSLTRSQMPESVNLDLNETVRATVAKLGAIMNRPQVTLHTELSPNLHIKGNANEIEQLVMQLVGNASDAIKEHGTVTLRTGSGEQGYFLSVEDTGEGMTPEVMSKVYDPFFTTKEVGKGTGLGMSIVKRIVDHHQGKIKIDSQVGRGTQVMVLFPARRVPA
ncbi:MAG: ATP-binding protein [Fibrobacterota bacterium]